MINHELARIIKKKPGLDRTKRNVLLIGKGSSNKEAKTIVNPVEVKYAKQLYGEDSELCQAYKIAKEITNDINIYTVNCLLFTDFIEIIDDLIHYNFDFIVPLDIHLRDTFVNPITNKITHFAAYYLERLGYTENKTVLVMTDHESHLYDDIDQYINDMKIIHNDFCKVNNDIINSYGNNLVFVLNNLLNNKFANVILAASLSSCEFSEYPADINIPTYFDIDYLDLKSYNNICFYKYHPITNKTSIEQLYNFRPTNDIYKKVLIDMLIKYVVSHLDLSEFHGLLFNPYVKVQIDIKVTKIMNEMLGRVFSSYIINSIYFKKTGAGVGNLIIDVSITPHSLLEKINILLEV